MGAEFCSYFAGYYFTVTETLFPSFLLIFVIKKPCSDRKIPEAAIFRETKNRKAHC
jgi:hypothetical protein